MGFETTFISKDSFVFDVFVKLLFSKLEKTFSFEMISVFFKLRFAFLSLSAVILPFLCNTFSILTSTTSSSSSSVSSSSFSESPCSSSLLSSIESSLLSFSSSDSSSDSSSSSSFNINRGIGIRGSSYVELFNFITKKQSSMNNTIDNLLDIVCLFIAVSCNELNDDFHASIYYEKISQSVMKNKPKNSICLKSLFEHHIKQENVVAQINILTRNLRIKPNDNNLRYFRAKCYFCLFQMVSRLPTRIFAEAKLARFSKSHVLSKTLVSKHRFDDTVGQSPDFLFYKKSVLNSQHIFQKNTEMSYLIRRCSSDLQILMNNAFLQVDGIYNRFTEYTSERFHQINRSLQFEHCEVSSEIISDLDHDADWKQLEFVCDDDEDDESDQEIIFSDEEGPTLLLSMSNAHKKKMQNVSSNFDSNNLSMDDESKKFELETCLENQMIKSNGIQKEINDFLYPKPVKQSINLRRTEYHQLPDTTSTIIEFLEDLTFYMANTSWFLKPYFDNFLTDIESKYYNPQAFGLILALYTFGLANAKISFFLDRKETSMSILQRLVEIDRMFTTGIDSVMRGFFQKNADVLPNDPVTLSLRQNLNPLRSLKVRDILPKVKEDIILRNYIYDSIVSFNQQRTALANQIYLFLGIIKTRIGEMSEALANFKILQNKGLNIISLSYQSDVSFKNANYVESYSLSLRILDFYEELFLKLLKAKIPIEWEHFNILLVHRENIALSKPKEKEVKKKPLKKSKKKQTKKSGGALSIASTKFIKSLQKFNVQQLQRFFNDVLLILKSLMYKGRCLLKLKREDCGKQALFDCYLLGSKCYAIAKYFCHDDILTSSKNFVANALYYLTLISLLEKNLDFSRMCLHNCLVLDPANKQAKILRACVEFFFGNSLASLTDISNVLVTIPINFSKLKLSGLYLKRAVIFQKFYLENIDDSYSSLTKGKHINPYVYDIQQKYYHSKLPYTFNIADSSLAMTLQQLDLRAHSRYKHQYKNPTYVRRVLRDYGIGLLLLECSMENTNRQNNLSNEEENDNDNDKNTETNVISVDNLLMKANILFNRSLIYLKLKLFDEAARDLLTILELKLSKAYTARLQLFLANVYKCAKCNDKALKVINEVNPQTFNQKYLVKTMKADIYTSISTNQDFEKGLKLYHHLARLFPYDTKIWVNYASQIIRSNLKNNYEKFQVILRANELVEGTIDLYDKPSSRSNLNRILQEFTEKKAGIEKFHISTVDTSLDIKVKTSYLDDEIQPSPPSPLIISKSNRPRTVRMNRMMLEDKHSTSDRLFLAINKGLAHQVQQQYIPSDDRIENNEEKQDEQREETKAIKTLDMLFKIDKMHRSMLKQVLTQQLYFNKHIQNNFGFIEVVHDFYADGYFIDSPFNIFCELGISKQSMKDLEDPNKDYENEERNESITSPEPNATDVNNSNSYEIVSTVDMNQSDSEKKAVVLTMSTDISLEDKLKKFFKYFDELNRLVANYFNGHYQILTKNCLEVIDKEPYFPLPYILLAMAELHAKHPRESLTILFKFIELHFLKQSSVKSNFLQTNDELFPHALLFDKEIQQLFKIDGEFKKTTYILLIFDNLKVLAFTQMRFYKHAQNVLLDYLIPDHPHDKKIISNISLIKHIDTKRKIISNIPDYLLFSFKFNFASLLFLQNKYLSAIEQLDELIQKHAFASNDKSVLLLRAKCKQALGQKEDAMINIVATTDD
eukprot:TRINITY_DN3115_c2_g4_i4.p1 TRINITY_DN3115_c2_g4~~TRINITY_DN3115_c2_g4_i4.p1  ORF type:complete len:1702 (+),score=318.41 TRINITY_DN3115_c2_g4_i4:3292-8397(+)